jgi:L-threonylcarbamoyladenylate synthase
MKLIKIDAITPEKDKMELARNTLKVGGTVIYPTDTVYGLGANVFHDEAVKKVYSFKKRPIHKPISVCVSKVEDIHKFAFLDQNVDKMVQKLFPGPYTLIFEKKEHFKSKVSSTNRIGIRIPDNPVCRELSLNFPITTTSANISGDVSPKSAEEALNSLGEGVDLIIDSGPCPGKLSSTVVDMTHSPPKILRQGAGMVFLTKLMGNFH